MRDACLGLAVVLLAIAGCGADPLIAPDPLEAVDPATLPMKHPGCNLIFISCDALQARHMGCLGYARDTTPFLDALAVKSFNFTRNTSVSSWTVPASMTWFTGAYPCEHGLVNKFSVYQPPRIQPAKLQDLSPQIVTLAQVLKANGYATAGFTGNAGVSGSFGYSEGFDEYVHEPSKFGSFQQSIPLALKWIRANRDRRFFVFLHGYDVHGQSIPPGGFDYRFVEPAYDGKFTGAVKEQETLREEGLENGRISIREEDIRFWRAIYDEKIQRADAKLNRFLQELEALGLPEKTLLVVTSDHGTEFFEHGRLDHGFTLYDELLHVPLLIRMPGQHSGKKIADRVSSIDLMPTILDLLDLSMAENAQPLRGSSLTAAMRSETASRDVFSETDYRQYTYQRSIIASDGWKLIYTLEHQSRELYDLNGDPGEQNNLAQERPALADELEQRLFGHFKSLGHDLRMQRWETSLNPVYDSQAKP